MHNGNDIILAVDYHLEHLEVRWLDCANGQEQCRNIPTQRRSIRMPSGSGTNSGKEQGRESHLDHGEHHRLGAGQRTARQ